MRKVSVSPVMEEDMRKVSDSPKLQWSKTRGKFRVQSATVLISWLGGHHLHLTQRQSSRLGHVVKDVRKI